MTPRASDDLRWYLRRATLPTMEHVRSSRESFDVSACWNIRPERYRTLRLVHTINPTLFGDIVSDWVEESVPSEPLGVDDEDERTGQRFTVPCDPFSSIVPLPLARADDIERVFVWVDMLPLESVRRILNLLYADTRSWKFLPCEDGPFLKTLTWSSATGDRANTAVSHHALCLFLMPPWVLTTEDLEEFARGQSFPDRSSPESLSESAFEGREWLWSKIWDTCVSRNCPWFILTTYRHWVFGVFSTGMSVYFLANTVLSYRAGKPTILEVFVFWLISAMGHPGGFVTPAISHELAHRNQLLVATPRDISREESADVLATVAV